MRRGLAAGAVACAWLTLPAAQNLYEWMGVAPVVVVGRVVVDDQRYIEVDVVRTLVGDLPAGARVQVDQRSANRDREPGQEAVRMENGTSFLLLLEPLPAGKKERLPRYALVRGVLGTRPVPAEGGAVLVDAAERLAAVHALSDDSQRWLAFEQMIEETNPLLLRTALEMLLKFHRGAPREIPLLRPLLDHPQAEVRGDALLLISQIVDAHGSLEASDDSGLAAEIIGRARRDSSVEVRIAAAQCLASLGGPRIETVLQEIARTDPEQQVRYAAQRLLLEKSREIGSPEREN